MDARTIDIDQIRRLIARATGDEKHDESSTSTLDALAVLYGRVLRVDPTDHEWPQRDRFILSKGHGCLALYVMLADKGFISPDTLDTFCHRDSILGGHPEAGRDT